MPNASRGMPCSPFSPPVTDRHWFATKYTSCANANVTIAK